MLRILRYIFIFLFILPVTAFSQEKDSVEVYLLTCLPGKDVANVYGHSAIRIVDKNRGIDQVYNWGVYDFKTPNFAWKFAKGRLNYKIADCPYEWFLQSYIQEERSVISQKMNLGDSDKKTLLSLIDNNMLPENEFYLYDFLYDNCATRIRDIFEKTLGDRLIYPQDNPSLSQSFRKKINRMQEPIPWLSVGTDLLIGMKGDKKAGFREQMFLPDDLMLNLSEAKVQSDRGQVPLLEKPVLVLDYKPVEINKSFFTPVILMILLLVVITALSFLIKSGSFHNLLDGVIFFVLSVISVLMVFFVFFTDHQVMKLNMNIIWLNPLLILAFISLFVKRIQKVCFRIILVTSVGFLCSMLFLPQSINIAFIPLILILILRSAFRSRIKPGIAIFD